jgi:DegV family protein with EDD domain
VPVVVVTDSAAGLPAGLAADLDIQVVPLHVLIDGVELREGIDPMPDGYANGSATTSAASPGELRETYERAYQLSGGDGVVAVHISRQLSGTWEAARQAADELDGAVRLVDSLGAGLGTGFVALGAARCARAGANVEQVYRAAVDVAEQASCYIVVDRLEQLRRGGRISTAAVVFGTALVTKPLLHIVDGRIGLAEKARTASKVFDKLVEAAVRAAGPDPVAIGVQHLDAEDQARRLVDQLRARVPQLHELIVAEFGPTLGVHLGSGSLGVVVTPIDPDDVPA